MPAALFSTPARVALSPVDHRESTTVGPGPLGRVTNVGNSFLGLANPPSCNVAGTRPTGRFVDDSSVAWLLLQRESLAGGSASMPALDEAVDALRREYSRRLRHRKGRPGTKSNDGLSRCRLRAYRSPWARRGAGVEHEA